MSTYPEANASQMRILPPGGQAFWAGTLGQVTASKYSFTYPGGPDKASATLELPAGYRHQSLALGSQVQLYRGGHQIWEGLLDEPAPSAAGWSMTSVGVGNQGADYQAEYVTAWPGNQPDETVNRAINRGLMWVNPGVGTPSGIWLAQGQDSASRSVADLLTICCTRGGLGWYVNVQPGAALGNTLSVAPLPTQVTRYLVVTTPVPRTSGGDVRTLWARYQSQADDTNAGTVAGYSITSVVNTGHGGKEAYIDLANAGVMSQGAAQAVLSQVLKVYQQASFAGPFTFGPGQLLTTGGVAVDPGCEQAGFVCRLIIADFAYGGQANPMLPVQFIVGGYEWDDHNRVGTITPYQTLDQSLSGMLSATQQTLVPVTIA